MGLMSFRARNKACVGMFVFAVFCSCSSPDRTASAPRAENAGTSTPAAGVAKHDLSEDEADGGHTLRKHVGRSDGELRVRLRREPNIAAASTYTDRAIAELAVSSALEQNRDKIVRWLHRPSGHPNLVLDYESNASRPLGRTLRRGEDTPQPCAHAVIILRWSGDEHYYVLTSYPECR
jgi:Bacterial CdiA-CT RNAse A domain